MGVKRFRLRCLILLAQPALVFEERSPHLLRRPADSTHAGDDPELVHPLSDLARLSPRSILDPDLLEDVSRYLASREDQVLELFPPRRIELTPDPRGRHLSCRRGVRRHKLLVFHVLRASRRSRGL